jgi:hypothetical protein
MLVMLQVLEQYGYDLSDPEPSTIASGRQSRRAHNDQTTSSVNAVPESHTAICERYSSAALRYPPRERQRLGPDVLLVVTLGVLVWSVVFVDLLPRLPSKLNWT